MKYRIKIYSADLYYKRTGPTSFEWVTIEDDPNIFHTQPIREAKAIFELFGVITQIVHLPLYRLNNISIDFYSRAEAWGAKKLLRWQDPETTYTIEGPIE